ncbi:MAG: TolC family protein, partial [Gemmatimonadaceae bacterium]
NNLNSPAESARDFASGTQTLDFATFMERVLATHPVARQANENIAAVRADRRVALGAFDPTLSVAFDRKAFGNTTYSEGSSAKLAVQTPLGVDLSVSFERASGVYLNPERRTPSVGVLSAAVRVPIGQRLLTDERRTGLAVANATLAAAEAERETALNKLLAQAAKDYALWYESGLRGQVARDAVALSEFRLSGTRQRVAAGEAAAIDTVEARLEVRRRAVVLVEAEQSVRAARAALATYWWNDTGRPQEFSETLMPAPELANDPIPVAGREVSPVTTAAFRWQAYVRVHPDVRRARARLEVQLSTARLARQGLLPNAFVEMGTLSPADDWRQPADIGSSKISAGLSQSLLLLRERGKAAAASARVNMQYADVARVEREVEAGITIANTELQTVQQLLVLQRLTVEDARVLQAAEQARFAAGESTLFLVNSRDRTVLEESLKMTALVAKRLTAAVLLRVALGTAVPSR